MVRKCHYKTESVISVLSFHFRTIEDISSTPKHVWFLEFSCIRKFLSQAKCFILEYLSNLFENHPFWKFSSNFLPLGEGNFSNDDSSELNNWILAEIDRVKAFPIEKLNLVPICRILRFLSKKNPLLNGLTSQWIDVLACKSFESARWPLTVGDGLRRVFGVISSGKGWNHYVIVRSNATEKRTLSR